VHTITPVQRAARTSEPTQPARDASTGTAAPTRALVLLHAAEPEKRAPVPNPRGYAPFITQLIATREQVAQARQRRRASVERGIADYRRAQVLRARSTRSNLGSA
jgi:hypothetical protein